MRQRIMRDNPRPVRPAASSADPRRACRTMPNGLSPALVVVSSAASLLAFAFRRPWPAAATASWARCRMVNMRHQGRARLWMLAVATAVVLTQGLYLTGPSIWGSRSTTAPLLSCWLSPAGGLMFGAGMTIAGGCPNKNLIRLGAGVCVRWWCWSFWPSRPYMTLQGAVRAHPRERAGPGRGSTSAAWACSRGLAPIVAHVSGVRAIPRSSARPAWRCSRWSASCWLTASSAERGRLLAGVNCGRPGGGARCHLTARSVPSYGENPRPGAR